MRTNDSDLASCIAKRLSHSISHLNTWRKIIYSSQLIITHLVDLTNGFHLDKLVGKPLKMKLSISLKALENNQC